MKAKFVNEALSFERHRNPKQALGLGGIDLYQELQDMIERQKLEWNEYLNKLLLGKTITVNAIRMINSDIGTKDEGSGNFTFNVKKIFARKTDENSNTIGLSDGKYYYIVLIEDNKIWIEKPTNESQSFERYKDPKKALDLGGIQLGVVKYEMRQRHLKEWQDYIKNLFLGKTITGRFSKYEFNGNDFLSKTPVWGEYTITVNHVADADWDDNAIAVSAEGDKLHSYMIPIGENKIWIKK